MIEAQKESQIQAARVAGEQHARAQAELAKSAATKKAYDELTEAHSQLRTMQRQLVDASRIAGIAELATGVLHNVGNALNSVNVSMDVVSTRIRDLRIESLGKLASLLEEHEADLADFIANDPRGSQLSAMVRALATALGNGRAEAMQEIANLASHVDHIKAVVRSQQSAAMLGGNMGDVDLVEVLDTALELQGDSLASQGLEVVRDYDELAPLHTDRHRVVQIVANLLCNARHALRDAGLDGRITIRLAECGDTIRISVSDEGPGVPLEIADRIFQHGFTTKSDGHGFGLHRSANLASELGGQLSLEPPVSGEGATFHLELPRQPATAAA
jgi:signal transduction histidine kinase